MKKKILISLLLVTFFNYVGCYSYYTLTEEEINSGRPLSDKSIKLILNDESEVECVPPSNSNPDTVYYLKVDTPGSYLIGRGNLLNLSTGVTSNFNGHVHGDVIDSSRALVTNSLEKYFVWTKNNNCFYFENGYYADIQPEDGAGYFIWKPKRKVQNISFSEVKEVQESYINWYLTGSLIAFFVATFVGFGIFLNEMNEGFNSWEY
jgi:hypothetical protein